MARLRCSVTLASTDALMYCLCLPVVVTYAAAVCGVSSVLTDVEESRLRGGGE